MAASLLSAERTGTLRQRSVACLIDISRFRFSDVDKENGAASLERSLFTSLLPRPFTPNRFHLPDQKSSFVSASSHLLRRLFSLPALPTCRPNSSTFLRARNMNLPVDTPPPSPPVVSIFHLNSARAPLADASAFPSFYLLSPSHPTLAVIASQTLITAVFSLSQQVGIFLLQLQEPSLSSSSEGTDSSSSTLLPFLLQLINMNAAPRFRMKQTSSKNQGQVYFGEQVSLAQSNRRPSLTDRLLLRSLHQLCSDDRCHCRRSWIWKRKRSHPRLWIFRRHRFLRDRHLSLPLDSLRQGPRLDLCYLLLCFLRVPRR